jgi:hypothetical protein
MIVKPSVEPDVYPTVDGVTEWSVIVNEFEWEGNTGWYYKNLGMFETEKEAHEFIETNYPNGYEVQGLNKK